MLAGLAVAGFLAARHPVSTAVSAAPGRKAWTDVVTRETVTEQTIEADKEFRLAEICRIRGQFREAVPLYRSALRLHSRHPQARRRLGFVLMKQRLYAQAEQELRDALRIDGDSYQTRYYLGMTMKLAGRLAEAERELAAAWALRPEHLTVGWSYYLLLGEMGRTAEARRVLERLQRTSPRPELVRELRRYPKLNEGWQP